MFILDGVELTESQRLTFLADMYDQTEIQPLSADEHISHERFTYKVTINDKPFPYPRPITYGSCC